VIGGGYLNEIGIRPREVVNVEEQWKEFVFDLVRLKRKPP
jgi:hypothetical protein